MSRRLLSLLCCGLAAATCLAEIPSVLEAHKAGVTDPDAVQFWRAMHDRSTQVPFVLIHVVQPNGSIDTYATSASFLLGAIHIEHRLPYTDAGEARALAIALSTPCRVFRFRTRKARQNVPRYYNLEVLQEVREALRGYSNTQLLEGFAVGGTLHSTYNRFTHPKAHAYEFAVAHVLLERGLIPSMHSQVHAIQ